MTATIRRIAVVTGDHSLPDPTKRDGRYNDEDFAAHAAMTAAFESLSGYAFSFWTDHGAFLEMVRTEPPDLVVNFCDTGLGNVPTREIHLPTSLELLGVPYTGAPPAAIIVCYDKEIVRLVAGAHGVPVPEEHFISADAGLGDLPLDRCGPYPALIKPNQADGSVGITKDAVVGSPEEAREYLGWLRDALPGRDALIQEYLPGPEYGLGLIGNPERALRVLPPLEVDFSGLPEGLAPILSYESKAIPTSPYWTEVTFKKAGLDEAATAELKGWTRTLFKRLGLRDYGRFDFRRAADGRLKLMEINPNPAWANDGKLAFMAGFAGIDYADMLRMVVDAAIERLTPAPG